MSHFYLKNHPVKGGKVTLIAEMSLKIYHVILI